jgi:hypothetical protein
MTPPAIVEAAIREGLAVIAICAHNAAGNVAATQDAALRLSKGALAVLAGMEITTAEEVHVLGLFLDAPAARAAAEAVRAALPDGHKARDAFGEQRLMDANGRVTGMETRMLATATTLGLSEAVGLIRGNGGLAVASHVDRPSFSVISQLGMLPEDVRFDALELSAIGSASGRAAEFARWGLPMLTSSDSHFLSEVGSGRTVLEMLAPTFGELALALRGIEGRRCCRA